MTYIIVAQTPDSDEYYNAEDHDEAALNIMRDRWDWGYYQEPDVQMEVSNILSSQNGSRAWSLLLDRARKGYEYEGVRIAKLR